MPTTIAQKTLARRPLAATAAALACAALLAACAPLSGPSGAAAAPPPEVADGPVRVGFGDPAAFAEARESPRELPGRRNEWLRNLQQHLAHEATRHLAAGQQLDVTITDIRRAGSYEPWRAPQAEDVRIVKDIYAPRIDLEFTLRAADGSVLRTGARALRDPMFLSRINRYPGSDPLRYEKTLIDDWLASEFRAARG
ncbi:DUF3016 domain-containing protein [Xylophilus sp.]|uniref:DUF3016 domain-containing protein n=1 Tax=Xylophilus sp. TaxID=2653893 RepID=UPI0013BC0B40|nr:DUF3016 domain-containing protein [Xylophilus sp.]KAF1045211.1 MAG: hypothetical protein GAK38_03172 [Xylophilus sp.]